MTARTFRRLFLASIACGAMGLVFACAGGKNIDVGDASTTTAASVTFSATVVPYLQGTGGCGGGGCHDATTHQSGLNLAGTPAVVYSNLVIVGGTLGNDIDTAVASSSLVLSKNLAVAAGGSDGAHPVHPFATTSDANYQKILTWVNAGALNN